MPPRGPLGCVDEDPPPPAENSERVQLGADPPTIIDIYKKLAEIMTEIAEGRCEPSDWPADYHAAASWALQNACVSYRATFHYESPETDLLRAAATIVTHMVHCVLVGCIYPEHKSVREYVHAARQQPSVEQADD